MNVNLLYFYFNYIVSFYLCSIDVCVINIIQVIFLSGYIFQKHFLVDCTCLFNFVTLPFYQVQLILFDKKDFYGASKKFLWPAFISVTKIKYPKEK